MLKTKKKVVDISVDDAVGDAVIQAVDIEPQQVVETVIQPVDIEPQQVVETVIQPVDIEQQQAIEAVIEKPIETDLRNTVKTSNLTQCPKCHKMIMDKTLKYTHSKTCGIVKDAKTKSIFETIRAPALINHVQNVSTIKPLNSIYVPPPPMTLDEMRRQYYNNDKQQRIQRIQTLFLSAIF